MAATIFCLLQTALSWLIQTWMTEAVDRRCPVKKVFFKISKKFTGKHLCHILVFNKVAGLRPATFLKKWLWYRYFPVNIMKCLRKEAVAQRCSVKKVFLKIFQNSQENNWAKVSFLIKLWAYFVKKASLAQVFPWEFYEISKNTFFAEHLRWLLLFKHPAYFYRTPLVAASRRNTTIT